MGNLIDHADSLVQHSWVQAVLLAAALAVATLVLSRVITRGLRHILDRDNNPLPSASIIINVARVALWVAAGSLILDICFGIKANGLVAALGVGGIAVSLGFQSTLSNLIGGLQITFMGIVRPGDHIEVGTERGVVQDVTWRHTTIRDALGQTVIIPNSVISTTALVHLLPPSRVVVPISVHRATSASVPGAGSTAGTDLDDLADRLAAAAREAAGTVSPLAEDPKVFFTKITDFGIEGSLIFTIADPASAAAAADAAIRAVTAIVG